MRDQDNLIYDNYFLPFGLPLFDEACTQFTSQRKPDVDRHSVAYLAMHLDVYIQNVVLFAIRVHLL